MWTDRNTGICYAAFHITSTIVSDDALELHDDLLDFSSFPYTERTSTNIKAWITELCAKWRIPLTAFSDIDKETGMVNELRLMLFSLRKRKEAYAKQLRTRKQQL